MGALGRMGRAALGRMDRAALGRMGRAHFEPIEKRAEKRAKAMPARETIERDKRRRRG